MQPGQHSLHQQLRFAIGVGGMEEIVLFNGSALRIAIERRRRRENETLDSGGEHHFEQGQRIGGVVAEKSFGSLHRLARFDERREMHDGIEGMRPEQMLNGGTIRQLAYYKFRIFRNRLTMAAAQ